jgi:hypothetical protein
LFYDRKLNPKFKIYSLASEALGFLTFFIFGLKLVDFLSQPLLLLLFLGFYSTVITFLLYLAIYETLHLSLPAIVVRRFIIVVLCFNIIAAVARFLLMIFPQKQNFGLPLGTIDNLLAGIIIYAVIFLIIKFIKNKKNSFFISNNKIIFLFIKKN